jgi:hypothetical protein
MAVDSSGPSEAADRLKRMLAGALPPTQTQAPTPTQAAPPRPAPAPPPAESEPAPVAEDVQEAPPEPRIAPSEAREKMPREAVRRESAKVENDQVRVLEGFHQWVVNRIAAVEPEKDDAAALMQVLVEIAGAAGFVTTLLSNGANRPGQ